MSNLISLSEIVQINPRIPKELLVDQEQKVSFVPMSAVSEEGTVSSEDERQLKDVMKGYTYFQKGDVLLAKITPCFENGKATVVKGLQHETGFGSTEFHVLRPGKDVDAKYLFYQVWNPAFRFIGGKNMTGTAGQKRIPTDFLKRHKILLPPLAEQKRIAAILEKADAIRRKRQQAIQLADDFLRATFLDMFGDPVTNPKGWEPATLGDFIHFAKDGPHVSPKYSETGIPFLSTRHVRPGKIIWTDLKYICREEAEKQWKKCKPEKGDILYTKGGTTGIATVFDSDQEIAVWVHIALLKTNPEKAEPYWLENMLNTAYCYSQSQRLTHGITNKDLGLKRMVNIQMYSPPLDFQKKFSKIVTTVRNSKNRQISCADKSDELFNSLTQRAFRGGL